jgi:hypothetical protein
MGQMDGRIKGNLHNVHAIFSYCPSGLRGSFIVPLLYVIFWEASIVSTFFGDGPIKLAHCKKEKLEL